MKIKTLAEKFDFRCYWCGQKYPLSFFSRDHVEPTGKSRIGGGERQPAGKGLLLACKSCNSRRGNKPFFLFLHEILLEGKHPGNCRVVDKNQFDTNLNK